MIEAYNETIFESIKHFDESGNEYWLARELQVVLEYKEWRKFKKIITKAIISCQTSNINVYDQFVQVDKLIKIGNGGKRKTEEYKLSRYACYLIVQNADSKKEVVALGQTYFAVQTRKQELFEDMSEDEKRLEVRRKVRKGNYDLNKTAIRSGVRDLAKFHNAGYKGLYNGETADDIAKRKGLRYREEILDHMGSLELGNNLFRILQTDDKLKRGKISSENKAADIHYKIGKEVRNSIKRMGGVMPEELETPNKSLKQITKDTK